MNACASCAPSMTAMPTPITRRDAITDDDDDDGILDNGTAVCLGAREGCRP